VRRNDPSGATPSVPRQIASAESSAGNEAGRTPAVTTNTLQRYAMPVDVSIRPNTYAT
jgi:hypothetical protein